MYYLIPRFDDEDFSFLYHILELFCLYFLIKHRKFEDYDFFEPRHSSDLYFFIIFDCNFQFTSRND